MKRRNRKLQYPQMICLYQEESQMFFKSEVEKQMAILQETTH